MLECYLCPHCSPHSLCLAVLLFSLFSRVRNLSGLYLLLTNCLLELPLAVNSSTCSGTFGMLLCLFVLPFSLEYIFENSTATHGRILLFHISKVSISSKQITCWLEVFHLFKPLYVYRIVSSSCFSFETWLTTIEHTMSVAYQQQHLSRFSTASFYYSTTCLLTSSILNLINV